MKAASIKELKVGLHERSYVELLDICLKFSRFKKENKELLTYLLFEADNETAYINNIKSHMDDKYSTINAKSSYLIKKSLRAILKDVKKYIRYSKNKETEVELLLYYCQKLKKSKFLNRSRMITNIYNNQIELVKRRIGTMHPDLQYDYLHELESI